MERYASYKDSGVEWLGEIPQAWTLRKLKYGVSVNPTKDNIDKESDEMVVFLPMEKVGEDGKIDCSIKKSISELYTGFTFFKKHDVIVAKITPCFENGKGALLSDLETDVGFGSTEFHVLRSKKEVSQHFLYYITKSEFFMKVGEAFMSGAAGQKRVPTDFISDFPLISPSLEQQIAIANYLDRKTAEIDVLIAQKERLIELYEEEKTAIINHAVTKGIVPNVKLKDSGIEWLGEIPEDWQVLPLRRLVDFIKTGGTPSGVGESHLEEGGYSWYAPSDFSEVVYLGLSKRALSNLGKNEVNIFPEMTVMMVGIGATIGKVGISRMESSCNQQINAIVCNGKVNPIFCAYYLKTLRNFIVQCGKYTTMPIINQDETKSLIVSLPPINEQEDIIHYIESELDRINSKISRTQRIIELQKEYRTALISEVVTGKVKVSHLANKEMVL